MRGKCYDGRGSDIEIEYIGVEVEYQTTWSVITDEVNKKEMFKRDVLMG
jgi:hypothetical protein